MADLATQTADPDGLAVSYVAAEVGGDTIAAATGMGLAVRNGGGSSVTIMVEAVTACDQGFLHDEVVTVPAGSERVISGVNIKRFINSANRIAFTYSGVASVTVAAVRFV